MQLNVYLPVLLVCTAIHQQVYGKNNILLAIF